MQEPLVSVKMITYNHGPYIRQAMECVLSQKTNFPFELVIGEDCSTDGTREIAFDFARRYPEIIRVITSEKNVGMKKNLYRTIQACRGKYIAFCEGDDYWHCKDKLQMQVDYLEGHPECGMVCSDCDYLVIENMQKISNYQKYRGQTAIESPQIDDILGGIAHTCTVVARTNLVVKLIEEDPFLYQSDHFKMGDTPLWFEISLLSKIHYIDQSLATYRVLDESMSRSKDKKKALLFLDSGTEMFLYLRKKHYSDFTPEQRQRMNRKCSEIIFNFGIWQSREGETGRSRKSFNTSLQLSPTPKSIVKYILTLLPGLTGLRLYEKWISRNSSGTVNV
jgi:glycosyltransferase involved in cell wall biosynthesis